MYVPEHFKLSSTQAQLELIRAYSFATLVTSGSDGLVATHLPVLAESSDTDITLRGHFARANSHWQQLGEGESLFIFQGPHCYISPNWYVSPQVPTWNYQSIHAYGRIELVENKDDLHQIVLDLSDYHEQNLEDPWIPDYDEQMLNAIVGFRCTISRLEAKEKLSQNKSAADRQGAISALRASGSENELAISDAMENTF